MIPKLIFSDIDGVWTDGGMYYDEKGNELKKFHTYDSAGILFCKMAQIPFGVISGEDSNTVKARAQKLKVEYIFLGVKNKVEKMAALCENLSISFNDVAYIGDDINDYELLKKVGLSACPSNAPKYIQKVVKWRLTNKGGEGVLREFVEKILETNGIDIVGLLKEHKYFVNE